MDTHTATVVLLGPQRSAPTVRDALLPLIDQHGSVAAITAGWEEREAEDLELGEHLDRAVENLQLHRRAEDVFARDKELFATLEDQQDRLAELQKLYRLRLRHLGPAARELLLREGPADLIEPECESAFEHLRSLDEHHLQRVDEIRAAVAERLRLGEREGLAQHRAEIAGILGRTAALCIAGGHVGVLANRLWLFDVFGSLPATVPVVAWSAGAMALAERIVLFHDSPPQGQGYAEVLGSGVGICRGVVPLPHASRRLALEDPVRVQLLKQRFPGAICAVLDENRRLTWDGRAWNGSDTTMQLTLDGRLAAVGGVG